MFNRNNDPVQPVVILTMADKKTEQKIRFRRDSNPCVLVGPYYQLSYELKSDITVTLFISRDYVLSEDVIPHQFII